MTKASELIQEQINFLKQDSTEWVPHAPYVVNEACAVVRRKKYPGADDKGLPESIGGRAIEFCDLATIKSGIGYCGIVAYNDSPNSNKETVLEILIAARDMAIEVGD